MWPKDHTVDSQTVDSQTRPIILQISFYIEDILDSKIEPKRADVDVSLKYVQYDLRKWGGRGSKAVWNFSENSSVLVAKVFPYH